MDPTVAHSPSGSFRAGTPEGRAAVALAFVLLLAAHAALAVDSLRRKSVTYDEVSHLPAGLALAATGEMRLNRQHPPLVKLLAGLAAGTAGPDLPLDGEDYRQGREWEFGREVLFGRGNDPVALLFRGRLPTVALSLVGGLAVFAWSRRRWGAGGGLLSLGLWAFSPTVLAHGRLVTMDVPVAALSTLALYLWWRAVRAPGMGLRLACGVVLGLALATKFGALVLPPAMVLSELAAGGVRGGWRRRLAGWATVFGAAAVVVQGFYLGAGGLAGYARGARLLYADLPADYAFYLAGRFRRGRFPLYFPIAFAVKSTVAELAAGVGAAAAGALRRRRDDLFIWLPAACWFAASMIGASNQGVRYLLPVYPLLFVAAGGLVPALAALAARWRTAGAAEGYQPSARSASGSEPVPRRDSGSPAEGAEPGRGSATASAPSSPAQRPWAAPALAALLVAAQAAEAATHHPDYIPYFNPLAGGTAAGPRWLDDSNLDWGEDVGRLPEWLEERGIGRVRMAWFGPTDPDHYGVEREPFPLADWRAGPRPGAYVVSAHVLVRGLLDARERGWRSDWLDRYRPAGVLGGSLYLYVFAEGDPGVRAEAPAPAATARPRPAPSPARAR